MLNCLHTRVSTRVLIATSHSHTLLRCSDAVQQGEQLRLGTAVVTGAAAAATMDQCGPDVVVVDMHPHVLAHVKKIYRKLAAHSRDERLAVAGKQAIRTVALGPR